ncbi:hypothetical protein [Streptomyces clavuligerus]|uniref:hypothetical protein n=1 Tax=Streptomyces clavuligerus TaxID=1901 RepID=UPI0001851782|nr:hypothetical protein [Streptomyces clavuligerus]WDN55755.1 hypothetical protein LL058_28055 [Streptomyces clavuligerus]WDN56434.1 hypothetical protein LL058_31840 [Streptomyces clavuligerus]
MPLVHVLDDSRLTVGPAGGAAVRYVRALKTALDDATPVWAAFTTARTRMDQAFATLAVTPDGTWSSAVSRLVAAHTTALTAAEKWDTAAYRIAAVHEHHHQAGLTVECALQLAGAVTASGGAGWIVGHISAYRNPWSGYTPAVDQVTATITTQSGHVRRVNDLTGTRT